MQFKFSAGNPSLWFSQVIRGKLPAPASKLYEFSFMRVMLEPFNPMPVSLDVVNTQHPNQNNRLRSSK